jgi:hypothetical protein
MFPRSSVGSLAIGALLLVPALALAQQASDPDVGTITIGSTAFGVTSFGFGAGSGSTSGSGAGGGKVDEVGDFTVPLGQLPTGLALDEETGRTLSELTFENSAGTVTDSFKNVLVERIDTSSSDVSVQFAFGSDTISTSTAAPELDAGSSMASITLFLGGLMVLRSRRSSRPTSPREIPPALTGW